MVEGSIADVMIRAEQRGVSDVKLAGMPGSYETDAGRVWFVAIDCGKRAIKAAMLRQAPVADAAGQMSGKGAGTLVTVAIPLVYQAAKVYQTGEVVELVYQFGDGDGRPVWVGEDALGQGRRVSDVAANGATAVRLAAEPLRHLIAAALVQVASAAGMRPGSYRIALGYAIPNDEIVNLPKTGGGEALGVLPDTQDAILAHIKTTHRCSVTRPDGTVERWAFEVVAVLPQAQTLGTYSILTTAPNGEVLDDIPQFAAYDLGGGDLQRVLVQRGGRIGTRMQAARLGDGCVRLARALRDRLRVRRFDLSIAAAHQALIDGTAIDQLGKSVNIRADVDAVIKSDGEELIADILDDAAAIQAQLAVSGGGAALLGAAIIERLTQTRGPSGLHILTGRTAVFANVVGSLLNITTVIVARARRAAS